MLASQSHLLVVNVMVDCWRTSRYKFACMVKRYDGSTRTIEEDDSKMKSRDASVNSRHGSQIVYKSHVQNRGQSLETLKMRFIDVKFGWRTAANLVIRPRSSKLEKFMQFSWKVICKK